MNDPATYQGRQTWTPFVNGTEATIPPMACVVVTGKERSAGNRNVAKAELMDATYGYGAQFLHRITWHQAVEPGATGYLCLPTASPILAAWDTADGTPAEGEVWGPIGDGAKLRKDVGGYRVLGKPVRGQRNNYAVLVLFEPLLSIKAQLTEDLAEGATATVDPYKADGTTLHSGAAHQFDVQEDIGGLTTAIETGSNVRAVWDVGRKRFCVVAASCGPVAEV